MNARISWFYYQLVQSNVVRRDGSGQIADVRCSHRKLGKQYSYGCDGKRYYNVVRGYRCFVTHDTLAPNKLLKNIDNKPQDDDYRRYRNHYHRRNLVAYIIASSSEALVPLFYKKMSTLLQLKFQMGELRA